LISKTGREILAPIMESDLDLNDTERDETDLELQGINPPQPKTTVEPNPSPPLIPDTPNPEISPPPKVTILPPLTT
jgi:hypothetical protein